MIKFRPDIRMGGIQQETVLALMMVNEWCKDKGWNMWVFSITEGKHSAGSLHYIGHAFDFWPDQIEQDVFTFGHETVKTIKALLGQDFDVIFEQKPLHIHVEFQPKTPMNG